MTTAPSSPLAGDGSSAFALTVDLAMFTIRDGVFCALLVRRGTEPFRGHWALPGGFVQPEESVESAAWRELSARTGLARFPGHLEQLRTYGDAGRDPRMRVVSVAHVAFAPDLPEPTAGTDTEAARWWPVDDLDLGGGVSTPSDESVDGPSLAFDHAAILADAAERVRSKLEYTTLATRFVAEPFSLKDLYRVYQAVWGVAPALPAFRRKVLSTNGFVVPAAPRDPVSGEPTLLYRRGDADVLQPAMLRTAPDETDERE
jgi:8-oxo-dGTP diphosphatase